VSLQRGIYSSLILAQFWRFVKENVYFFSKKAADPREFAFRSFFIAI